MATSSDELLQIDSRYPKTERADAITLLERKDYSLPLARRTLGMGGYVVDNELTTNEPLNVGLSDIG